jgi:cobalt-zinc-cadmium efflux system membrane fusion protein
VSKATLSRPGRTAASIAIALAVLVSATVLLRSGSGQLPSTNPVSTSASGSNAVPAQGTVDLAPSQLNAIKIDPVKSYAFPLEKEAVGSISFVDDLTVQVFPPYQGKLIKTFVELGDEVKQGRPLYTIDSPDLIQAESTLMGAAATLETTTKELARVKDLFGTNGVSQRELEQATSDQQTAEGALKAARDAVRVFGKTESEIDQIVASRKIDSALVVRSPIAGEVTAYNAPPGLLVQPGTGSAPFSVADVSMKWMLGNVTESDSPLFQVGQAVEARVMAYPGRIFKGRISKIYATVDPNTHRVTVRSEIPDPQHELRPGMLASFVIRVQDPVDSVAMPMTGVVRNGDGTMVAWVTDDRHRFFERHLKIGLQRDGQYQILEGLRLGELAVSDGALFLSNMLEAPPTD